MHHCNTHVGWYFGKFLIGFAGILFVYAGFIKEKDITCLCKAAARQWRRKSARENENSSPGIHQYAADAKPEDARSNIHVAVKNRKKSSNKKCRNQKPKKYPCPPRAIARESIDKTARCLEYVEQQRNYCVKMQNRKNHQNSRFPKEINKQESLQDEFSKLICDPCMTERIHQDDELKCLSDKSSIIAERSPEKLHLVIKFSRDNISIEKSSDSKVGASFYQRKIENLRLISSISPWKRRRKNNRENFIVCSKRIRSFRIQNMERKNSLCSQAKQKFETSVNVAKKFKVD